MKTEGLDYNTNNENDEISLKELVLKFIEWYNYLLSRWLVILTFVIIGAVLGALYASNKKVSYNATTTFVLESGEGSGSALGQYAGFASMAGIDLGGGGGGLFQGDNILELYKSRTMIQKTLLSEVIYNGKKQLLIDRYIEFNNLRKDWKDKPELMKVKFDSNLKSKSGSFTRLQDSILGNIVDDINKRYLIVSKPDKKLSIIKVDVNSSDEFFAKTFNDQIVSNVNDFYVQTKTKKSLANVAILKEKSDSVRAVMNGSIYSAAVVLDVTPNLNMTRQVQRVAPLQRSQFNAETNKAILGELVKNLEMSKMSLLKETPLIQVVDYPIFPLNTTRFGLVKGIVLGGFVAGFLTILVLLISKLLKNLTA